MSPENKEFIPERSLKGFVITPNTAVTNLESILGIRFPVKPNAIELSGRNRFIRAIKTGIIPTIASAILRKNDAVGVYDYRFHAYFFSPEERNGIFTALHENMHGFIAVVNPDISLQQELISQAVSSRFVGRPLPEVDIEKYIVSKSFDEGIAQWAAIEVASRLQNTKRLNPLRNLMLTGRKSSEVVHVDEKFMEGEFQKLEESKDLYHEALQLSGTKVMTKGAKAEAVIGDAVYHTGYYFVYHAMIGLEQQGLGFAEAITMLVKNPPTKISELRNPVNYPKARC